MQQVRNKQPRQGPEGIWRKFAQPRGVSALLGEPNEIQGKTIIPVASVRTVRGARGTGRKVVSPRAIIEVTNKGVRIKRHVALLPLFLAALLLTAWNLYWIARTVREWRARPS